METNTYYDFFLYKTPNQSGMRFEKSFKSYSNDQLLLCRE